MVFRGTGYNYAESREIDELMKHRERQLAALTLLARRDDELARELHRLDEDIARGIADLDRATALRALTRRRRR